MMKHAGALNVAAVTVKGARQVSLEQVLQWNPEVIFVQGRYPQVVKQIENDPQWQAIDAVKNHRVWLMPEYAKAWGYPMPEALAIGELWMAKKLYPSRYRNVDVDAKAQDYYQRFYRVKWSPDAQSPSLGPAATVGLDGWRRCMIALASLCLGQYHAQPGGGLSRAGASGAPR